MSKQRSGGVLLALAVIALTGLTVVASTAVSSGADVAHSALSPRAQSTQAAAVTCAVRVARLQVREGPGTVYRVRGQLTQNTVVRAVAFVPQGLPSGRWAQVQLTPGTSIGFVAAETPFLLCRNSLSPLPTARIPATPQPTPTRTPRPTPTRIQPLALVPVAGDLSASPNIRGRDPRNDGALVVVPGLSQAQADETLEQDGLISFDDALVFGVDVFDDNVGTRTGAGIKQVQFDVYYDDENGERIQVHFQREVRAPYCVFGDVRGMCNVWRFSEHGNRWPNGELLAPDTVFRADITIVPVTGEPALWLWNFRMD